MGTERGNANALTNLLLPPYPPQPQVFLCFVETKEQSWADATTAATQQLFSGQEVLAYSIMALFVVATPFRHRGIDTFFFYFVCHGSSNMLSRCLFSQS